MEIGPMLLEVEGKIGLEPTALEEACMEAENPVYWRAEGSRGAELAFSEVVEPAALDWWKVVSGVLIDVLAGAGEPVMFVGLVVIGLVMLGWQAAMDGRSLLVLLLVREELLLDSNLVVRWVGHEGDWFVRRVELSAELTKSAAQSGRWDDGQGQEVTTVGDPQRLLMSVVAEADSTAQLMSFASDLKTTENQKLNLCQEDYLSVPWDWDDSQTFSLAGSACSVDTGGREPGRRKR